MIVSECLNEVEVNFMLTHIDVRGLFPQVGKENSD